MQSTSSSNLVHLSSLVTKYLQNKGRKIPKSEVIRSMIEVAFYASMKCEESRRVVCTFVFVDSKNPAGSDPPYIRPQRRSYIAFEDLISFNVRNLAKLSQAVPPWAACVAVCEIDKELFVCGLFDQEVHYRNSLNWEGEVAFPRPGLFQIELTGIGCLAICDNSCLIASLSQNTLVDTFYDVLHKGPISKSLAKLFLHYEPIVRKLIEDKSRSVPEYRWKFELGERWIRTLSRILLNIKRAGHGGALLLSPQSSAAELNAKYKINYHKLETVIPKHVAYEVSEQIAWEGIQHCLDEESEEIPTRTYLKETVSAHCKEDSIQAELGCVNFVASLAQVDGCVLLSPGFCVRGFGVEITTREDPSAVFTAADEQASKAKLRPLNFAHFGTRHRSMMRYCYSKLGSVGFVVSQDGDIRAITRVGKKLVLWDNVLLQDLENVKEHIAVSKT